ncbi:biotin transporter BioY [bacterium]|nr:biotin transporter BioY [bacterium]
MPENTLQRNKAVSNIAKGAVLVALTVVSAQIAIPLPPVPWTLQVFTVLLSGAIGGSAVGAISQLIYILLGLIGLPVFSGFSGGLSIIISPTFGYLIGFPIAAGMSGLFNTKKGLLRRSPLIFLASLIPIYVIGAAYFYCFAPIMIGKVLTVKGVIAVGIVPFIIPDIVKAILAWVIARRLN